ncbi:MAG: 6-phosphogluconolactonase [Verrucomicrobiales bacterium]|nr:6-phosphogluconolactonase [Verrucomicrobiales bacterium]
MAEVIETENFVSDACECIAAKILKKQKQGEVFSLSLCGGSTPAPIYRALAERKDIDWDRVLITFGDERCVGSEDMQSNYRMVREALLDVADVPSGNVIRIEGELDAAEAASKCEQRLRDLAEQSGQVIFKHDLVLLGMGEDGHTASLFPGSKALNESSRWVIENFAPSQDSWRLTMTYPLINAAEEVLFLINGDKKRKIMQEIFAGGSTYPAAAIKPVSGQVTWIVGV